MKTTIDLPEDLVRQIKIRAVHERIPVKRLVATLLRQSLNAPPPPPEPASSSDRVIFTKANLPVFRCREDAPARRLTAEEIVAMEQEISLEEDMRRAGLPS